MLGTHIRRNISLILLLVSIFVFFSIGSQQIQALSPAPDWQYIDNTDVEIVSASEVIIHWETNLDSSDLLYFGTDPENLILSAVPGLRREHSVPKSGLDENTTYYFYVQAHDDQQEFVENELESFSIATTQEIMNLQVHDIKSTTATVTWDTWLPSTTALRYGVGQITYGKGTVLEFSSSHSVKLDNLLPGIGIWFNVTANHGDDEIKSNTIWFATDLIEPSTGTSEDARLQALIDRLGYETSLEEDELIIEERQLTGEINFPLLERLSGKILLQTEKNGEAWYVDSQTQKRYYLANGDAAYTALGVFGVGITNNDLEKIPVGLEDEFQLDDTDGDGLADKLEIGLGTNPDNIDSDGDGYDDGVEVRNGYDPLGTGVMEIDESIASSLRGQIVLQVEENGEAWYIHPETHHRYYMANGELAYEVMRFLNLGITNKDIRQIPVGDLE